MKGLPQAVSTMRVTDSDVLAAGIRGADLEPCQLSGGPRASELVRVPWGGACLDVARLGPSMRFAGAMAPDSYALVSVLACPQPGQSFNFAIQHGAGYLALFPPGGLLDAYTPEGYHNATLSIPVAEFHALLASHFPDFPDALLARGAALPVGADEHRALADLVTTVCHASWDPEQPLNGAAARDLAGHSLIVAFLAALRSGLENLARPDKPRTVRRQLRLRQTLDYLAARGHEPVLLDDLCSEIGLNRRAMENLFQDFLGVTPAIYLKRQRLHGVRCSLRHKSRLPGVVKATALEWGFWHMGHFTHDYQALFGELPSETLGGRVNE
jgi:AraC family transcriptional regulator, ethanolamine operon transcriptional activator